MNGLWVIFWASILVVCYLIFSMIWFSLLSFFKIKNKKIKFLSSVICFLLLIIALDFYYKMPSVIFENTFGFPPIESISDIQAEAYSAGDFGYVFLKFKATPEIVKKIVSQGFKRDTLENNYRSVTINPPEWFRVPNAEYIEHYSGSFAYNFASEQKSLFYDPLKKEVYFFFSGVD